MTAAEYIAKYPGLRGLERPGRRRIEGFVAGRGGEITNYRAREVARLLRGAAPVEQVPHDPGPLAAPESRVERIERRIGAYRRKQFAKREEIVTWLLPCEPIGVQVQGDPHVDDDGCDWPRLVEHLRLCRKTEGLHAACLGDVQNNWIGRLVRLYADQTTSKAESVQLAQDYFALGGHWAAVVGGNHDEWEAREFRRLINEARVRAFSSTRVRLEMRFEGAGVVRLEMRHDYKGHSQWNPLHGLMKALRMDPWPDVVAAGHKHIWGAHKEELHGRSRLAIRARGYKRMDSYAAQLQFAEEAHGEAATLIIDPRLPEGSPDRVRVYWDAEAAADVLTWMRSR